MLNALIESEVQCPYCWESFAILVDTSVDDQQYIEDCEVCCRPIEFEIRLGEGETLDIEAKRSDE